MRSGTFGIVMKQTGSLLNVLGIIFILPFIVSAMYDEWFSAAGFLLSACVVLGIGLALYKIFNKAEDPQYNHGLIIAASSWLIITLMGAIPFFIIAKLTPDTEMSKFIPSGALYKESSLVYFNNFLHCFFESMSAYTTTGLSMAIHEPSVGKGVLFYRSLAQWVGGAGFIVMALAVFKQTSGQGAMLLYGAESTSEKLMPKVIDTSRAIWRVYFLLTAFTIVYLIVGTKLILPNYSLADNVFDSVNHAMSGLSTGGFSTLDDMMSTYQSPYMEMLYLLPMILGSFSIPFYYKLIFKGKISEIWTDIQTRSLIIAFVAGSIIQSFLLFKANAVPEPVREGVFQFVSALSTTGWQTSNIHHWDWVSVVFIVTTAMFIGGASGATVGGIKMIRALLIKKGLRWQVTKVFLSSNTVKTIRFNGKILHPEVMNEEFTKAASMAIMFVLLTFVSSLLTMYFTDNTFSYSDALFEAASAQGTVGLSSGITDPSMSPVLESVYIFQMWTGRLEIIPVFALIRAVFMGTKPRNI